MRYGKTAMMTIAASTLATNRLVDMRLALEKGECHFLLVSHNENDAFTEDWHNKKECERAMWASQPKRFEPVPHQPRYASDCIEVKQGRRRVGELMTLRGTPPRAIFRPLRRGESQTRVANGPCEVD